MAFEAISTVKDLIRMAQDAESNQQPEQAIELYKKAVKEDSVNEYAYDRLFVIYRKLKQYKEEAKAIKAGIKAFENLYKKKSKFSRSKKVTEISNALLKSTGLADKKGNHLYDPEPIGKWKKRLIIVEKKATKI